MKKNLWNNCNEIPGHVEIYICSNGYTDKTRPEELTEKITDYFHMTVL